MLRHGSLFSGIGGFDLAAQWMEWENIFHCEIDPFCQKVLKYHFPKSKSHEDIKQTDFTIYRGQIDVLSGGFPCQPFSVAGERKGSDDDRHLWPEMCRAIKEIQPRWVVGENVRGIINWNGGLVFEQVQSDLENEGYEVQSFILPACGVDAPHRRDRVWVIGYRTDVTNSDNIRLEHSEKTGNLGEGEKETQGKGSESPRRIKTKSGEWNVANSDSWRTQTWSFGKVLAKSDCQRKTSGFIDESISRNVTNSESIGCIRSDESRSHREQERNLDKDIKNDRNQIRSENERCGSNVTNSDSDRLEGSIFAKEHKQQQSKKTNDAKYISQSSRRPPISFEEFPTQSPICGGNDGISEWLDGITFPKWRRETIKAYGNAIVPQVVFPIFKVIEEMDKKKGIRENP